MSLKNKVSIISGGEKGIGRGIVRHFLSLGMKVCIAGINREAAQETISEMNAGDRLIFLETDVREEAMVADAVRNTVEHFGRLDSFIANAGLPSPRGQAVETLTLDKWNEIISTNLTGVFLCAKHAFPELRKTQGSMVLIASTRALQSEPDSTAYAASKGGVIGLAHSLAVSGGPDIRVNAISPGWIYLKDPTQLDKKHHDFHPVGRVGHPGDIASMTAWLISDEAGFITGQNFVVDGGVNKKMYYA